MAASIMMHKKKVNGVQEKRHQSEVDTLMQNVDYSYRSSSF